MKTKIVLGLLFILHGLCCVSLGVMWPELKVEESINVAYIIGLQTIMSALASALASRIKDKKAVLIGGILMILSSFSYIFSLNIIMIVVSTVVGGASIGMLMVGINSYITEKSAGVFHGLWMLGAAASPMLFSVLNWRSGNVVIAFLLILAIVIFFKANINIKKVEEVSKESRLPLFKLLILSFLLVGIDTSFGKCLTTYATEFGYTLGSAKIAATSFFAGMLLGRASSFFMKNRWPYIAIAVISLFILLITGGKGLILFVGIFAFGLGPLFPWALSQGGYREKAYMQVAASVGAFTLPILAVNISFLMLSFIAMIFIVIAIASNRRYSLMRFRNKTT